VKSGFGDDGFDTYLTLNALFVIVYLHRNQEQ